MVKATSFESRYGAKFTASPLPKKQVHRRAKDKHESDAPTRVLKPKLLQPTMHDSLAEHAVSRNRSWHCRKEHHAKSTANENLAEESDSCRRKTKEFHFLRFEQNAEQGNGE